MIVGGKKCRPENRTLILRWAGYKATAATGKLLPIAAVTVYIRCVPLPMLFLGFLPVVVFALYA